MNELIPITDSTGRSCGEDEAEPAPGSVVLTQGEFGTAWQRWFHDGRWHRAGSSQAKDWEWFLTQRNVVLAYDAPVRLLDGETAASA